MQKDLGGALSPRRGFRLLQKPVFYLFPGAFDYRIIEFIFFAPNLSFAVIAVVSWFRDHAVNDVAGLYVADLLRHYS